MFPTQELATFYFYYLIPAYSSVTQVNRLLYVTLID